MTTCWSSRPPTCWDRVVLAGGPRAGPPALRARHRTLPAGGTGGAPHALRAGPEGGVPGPLACTLWFLGRPDAAAPRAVCSARVGRGGRAPVQPRRRAHLRGRARRWTWAMSPSCPRAGPEFAAMAQDGMHAYLAAAFRGYLAVLDGDTEAGLAAIRASPRRRRRPRPRRGRRPSCSACGSAGGCSRPGTARCASPPPNRLLAMGGAARAVGAGGPSGTRRPRRSGPPRNARGACAERP